MSTHTYRIFVCISLAVIIALSAWSFIKGEEYTRCETTRSQTIQYNERAVTQNLVIEALIVSSYAAERAQPNYHAPHLIVELEEQPRPHEVPVPTC